MLSKLCDEWLNKLQNNDINQSEDMFKGPVHAQGVMSVTEGMNYDDFQWNSLTLNAHFFV